MANIIEINENCAIEIVLGGMDFFKVQFVKLLIVQESDNILPRFQLELEMRDTSILKELKKNNTIIELNYGRNAESIVKREFRVKNHRLSPKGNNFAVTISGILNVSDYTNKLNIIAINKNSHEVLKDEIKGLNLVIDYVGNDKQVWIRHNIPEKEFVDRVLQNAYIAEDDLVLSSLNVDKKLRIVSLKDEFAKKELFTFINEADEDGTDIRFESFHFETDDSIWKYLLSEGTKQPVYHLKTGELEYIEANGKSVKNGDTNEELTESRNAPILIDNGNCFAKYYNAQTSNLSNKANFFSNSIYINVSQRFFKEDELSLLDIIKILPNGFSGDIDDTIKGKYLITGKDILLNQKGFNQRFRLNRDYML